MKDFKKCTLLKDVPVTYSDSTSIPTPIIKPQFNISDVIIIKNALQTVLPELIPELQGRVLLIIQELFNAEIRSKEDVSNS